MDYYNQNTDTSMQQYRYGNTDQQQQSYDQSNQSYSYNTEQESGGNDMWWTNNTNDGQSRNQGYQTKNQGYSTMMQGNQSNDQSYYSGNYFGNQDGSDQGYYGNQGGQYSQAYGYQDNNYSSFFSSDTSYNQPKKNFYSNYSTGGGNKPNFGHSKGLGWKGNANKGFSQNKPNYQTTKAGFDQRPKKTTTVPMIAFKKETDNSKTSQQDSSSSNATAMTNFQPVKLSVSSTTPENIANVSQLLQATEAQQVQEMDTTNGTDETKPKTEKLKPWMRPDFQRIKRKKSELKNFRLKKILSPKNAVASLNELKTDIQYKVEQESTGIGHPFCISVEVDGQTYRGYGSSKQLAKQAAAEAALISFVRPAVPKEPTAETEEPQEEDKTPWATLASFAVYKLFNDWRGGRVGMCQPPAQQFATDSSTQFQALSAYLNASEMPKQTLQPQLPKTSPQGGVFKQKPAKQLPENAAQMHPVMLLHQMRPEIQYSQSQMVQDNKSHFVVSAVLDGVSFSGEGPNVKKAKFNMALTAVKQIFAIDSQYQPPKN